MSTFVYEYPFPDSLQSLDITVHFPDWFSV